ncbi:hypothetical protein MycrhDRAFT_6350 [Mycolicibacterium rhodesiae JS60]|nr:hypothetical protein MycrhDRAFT_6350 [Mycolicibacterium rhodesiae JS60]
MNYLASPPLVVAYALAGTMDIDFATEPLGHTADGTPVLLTDLWPEPDEIRAVIEGSLSAEMFTAAYRDVFTGDQRCRGIDVASSEMFPGTTNPPTFVVRRTSTEWPWNRNRCPTPGQPGCW